MLKLLSKAGASEYVLLNALRFRNSLVCRVGIALIKGCARISVECAFLVSLTASPQVPSGASLRASAALAWLPIRERAGREHASDPARCCCPGIVRAGVERDGRLGRGTVDRVDHGFEQTQPTGWEADTCANHYAVIDVTG